MSAADRGSVWSTERPNPRTEDLDRLGTLDMVRVIHAEDHVAVRAVDEVLEAVAKAVDVMAEAYRRGGRWLFVGAGTSGRIALAEAAECPPTFGTPPERIVAVMAGGPGALARATEGAEDDGAAAAADLEALGLRRGDVVVGLAASGRTPYVLAAVDHARAIGAATIGVTSVPGSALCDRVDVAIAPDTGPEAVLGSTRLKAGTAQKLVTNMLTTAAMVRLGRVYRNLMVDMKATNEKLRARAVRLVVLATDCAPEAAQAALDDAGGSVKQAIVQVALGVDATEAARLLTGTEGHLRPVLDHRS
jgi:N-acetylmuramic acid 6-phosphate etherase